jgi:tetratricopeptide (TPR) repeat protein
MKPFTQFGRRPSIARWIGLGRTTGLTLSAAAALWLGLPRPAWAGDVEDANGRLVDLEERVRTLATQFQDAPISDPNVADRRVLDAEMLFNLKNYDEAATVLLDVIEKYPNSRAYEDAIVLLGDSLYQNRDLYSARRYLRQAVEKKTGSRQEQKALQRLLEIALHTGDYEGVDDYLHRLEAIPPQSLEPSVPYVRGKYAYFRNRFDEAVVAFRSVPEGSPYHLQARYFLATLLVKNGDLGSAVLGFDAVTRIQPRNEADKEVQDMARLALGRLHYERGSLEKAKEAYNSIPRESKHFEEAMDELAWTSIKANDFQSAYRALDLMLLQNEESPKAPELRLLMGNLHVRLANFSLANDAFLKSRDQFEPVHQQLRLTLNKCEADPKYFESLIGKGMEKFDVSLFVPKDAVKYVKADPDVAQVVALTENVGELQRGLKDSAETLNRLEMAVGGQLKVGIFPDLAQARAQSSEVLNQIVDIRSKFVGKLRSLTERALSPEDKARLDQLARERVAVEAELKDLPMTVSGLKDREKKARADLERLDGEASEFNVQIQGLEAELVAIEQYFIKSRAEQKISPSDLTKPVEGLREAITELRSSNEHVRNEIAQAAREATVAAATGDSDRGAITQLLDVMRREREIYQRARPRLSGGDQADFDAISNILGRADGVQGKLAELDRRVDVAAQKRLGALKESLAVEKGELEKASGKLDGLLTESRNLGGGLAFAMLGKITDRFYDIVVQSDVGLVDVAWGLKDQRTSTLSKLINQQKMELKSAEEDFRALLEEDK